MTDFAANVRAALEDKNMSMRSAARALNYDPAYLSRVLNGKQAPSRELAEALDKLLCSDGALISSAMPHGSSSVQVAEELTGIDGEIKHVRDSVAHLLDHDNRYGGDQIALAAVQVWRAAQRRLDSGTVPDRSQREYVASVTEAAQVAGWLLFDSDQRGAARNAFLEAQTLARHAGDRSMEWFATDMIAMQSVQDGRPGESLRVADELLSGLRVPPRVALLARVRRSRALSSTGDRGRALTEMKAAWTALDDSISPRDPSWAWWVNECELSGHEGEVFLALGEVNKALPRLHRARELAEAFRPAGRGVLYYSVAELEAYAAGRAWRECEEALTSVPSLLEMVSSGRSRHRLRTVLGGITRDAKTPVWLSHLARDVQRVPQLSSSCP